MKSSLKKCLPFLCMALVTSTSVGYAADLRIGGGAAPMENIFKRIKDPFEKSSSLKLVLSSEGPVEAFKALDQGKADIATAGLTFGQWLETMEKSGYSIADKAAFKSRVIGRDRIQVFTHKGVAVKELSKAQLKDIFTGKTLNWKDVGGPNLPIVLVMGSKIQGTNKTFSDQILEKQEFNKANLKEATDAPSVLQTVTSTGGAIGIGPMAADLSAVNLVKTPEIGRPITAVTKGLPSESVNKLFDFIRTEGQKHILQ